jgi:hypothetical protein
MFHVSFPECGFCQDPITSVPEFLPATWNHNMSSDTEHVGQCITQLLQTVWSWLHKSYLCHYTFTLTHWEFKIKHKVHTDSIVYLKPNLKFFFFLKSLGVFKSSSTTHSKHEYKQNKLHWLHSKSIIWLNHTFSGCDASSKLKYVTLFFLFKNCI